MPFPIKICAICSEEFELKPDKPGFANRCPECSVADEETESGSSHSRDADERRVETRSAICFTAKTADRFRARPSLPQSLHRQNGRTPQDPAIVPLRGKDS